MSIPVSPTPPHPPWCDPNHCTAQPDGRGWHQSTVRSVGPTGHGTIHFNLWVAAQDPTPGYPGTDMPHLNLVVVYGPSWFPEDGEVEPEEILIPIELVLPLGRYMVEFGKLVSTR